MLVAMIPVACDVATQHAHRRSDHPTPPPPLNRRRPPSLLQAVTHYNNPTVLAEVSGGLGEAMVGIDVRDKNFNSYAQRSE